METERPDILYAKVNLERHITQSWNKTKTDNLNSVYITTRLFHQGFFTGGVQMEKFDFIEPRALYMNRGYL